MESFIVIHGLACYVYAEVVRGGLSFSPVLVWRKDGCIGLLSCVSPHNVQEASRRDAQWKKVVTVPSLLLLVFRIGFRAVELSTSQRLIKRKRKTTRSDLKSSY